MDAQLEEILRKLDRISDEHEDGLTKDERVILRRIIAAFGAAEGFFTVVKRLALVLAVVVIGWSQLNQLTELLRGLLQLDARGIK